MTVESICFETTKILFNKLWVSLIQLCYNGNICNHLPSHHPCNLHRYMHKTGLCYLGGKHETCAWRAPEQYKLFEMKQWPQRVWGQGSQGKNCKWHVHPRASSNNFLRRGWGPLFSPLSSLTGLWGVMCKYGSVMNLFSFSKPPCCLLNHSCSAWATILSPTAALALKLWTAESGVDCKQIQTFCPV